MLYDVIVIGGGPAGLTAAATVAQQNLRCALLTQLVGGQLNLASAINNWHAQDRLSGKELTNQLVHTLKVATKPVEMNAGVRVKSIRLVEHMSGIPTYLVTTDKDDDLRARAVILAMGAHHKTLGVPGEERLTGKGVSYCAVCDGVYFKGKTVAVVGDDDVACQELSRVARQVYSLRSPKEMRPRKVKNVEILYGALPLAILGQDHVVGLRYLETPSGQTKEIVLDGVFIEAGVEPSTELLKDLVDTDDSGHIVVDHQTMATSGLGIFAAGDVTDSRYKQVSVAVGDGTKAALSAAQYITTTNEEKK